MRKAAAVLFVLGLGLSRSVPAESPPAHRSTNGAFALSDAQDAPGFSLAAHGVPDLEGADAAQDAIRDRILMPPGLDPTALGTAIPVRFVAGTASLAIDRKSARAPLSLSLFMGRGHGDLFSTLHEPYAWRTIFRSMNLGAGIFRDIPIAKGIRLQPYMGVIRSYARLRPSYLYGSADFEYRLTAVCIGLPLVCGFN